MGGFACGSPHFFLEKSKQNRVLRKLAGREELLRVRFINNIKILSDECLAQTVAQAD
jgi:hypothetical protein